MKTWPSLLLLLFSPALALAQHSHAPLVLDVEHYEIEAEVIPERSSLKGEVRVRLRVLQDTVTLPFELNNRLSIIEIKDVADFPYSLSFNDVDSSRMGVKGAGPFKQGVEKTLIFRFEGILEKEEYAFLDKPLGQKAMIDSAGGILLSEGKWFPVHRFPLDAATASIRISAPLGFTVVAPGNLQAIETSGISEIFHWKSEQPVTQAPVVIARYYREMFEEGPIPLTLFVTQDYDRDLRPLAKEIEQILEFLNLEYGPYPISGLSLAQVGNLQLRSTGCAGLILLEASLWKSKSLPIMELATRVANQWWGYSVRPLSSSDFWMQDGFSTYSALRYVEEKYPDRFASELSRQAIQALKHEKNDPISKGLELEIGSERYQSIIGSKGAWVLYMLSQLVGKEKMNDLLREWFLSRQGEAVTTSAFADFIGEKTGQPYQWFFVQWVDSVGVPEFQLDYRIYKLRGGDFKLRGHVKQEIELFRMPVDVLIETKGQSEEKRLQVIGKSTSFTFESKTLPVRMRIDPHGKILRESEGMRVAVHIALGEDLQEQGEFVTALREYEMAKTLNERSSLAHYRLGEVYFLQRSFSSSANSLRDALNGDLEPKWVETWTHIYLGKIFDILGQRQRARAEYQKALNTKINHQGSEAEATRYLSKPFSTPRSSIE